MNIQFGTVDGLVNISEEKIRIFINAVKSFSKEGLDYASAKNISVGTAFQRYVEPVYNGIHKDFDLKDIDIPVLTKNGKEQSPARVTFCKKMGLLNIDDNNNVFQLTPLGEELWSNSINIEEYAFILLSKLGLFKDHSFSCHIMSYIYEWFLSRTTITENDIKNSFSKDTFVKTRIDIILNAFSTCGLLSNIGQGKYVLSNIKSAEILKCIYINRDYLSPAQLDDSNTYTDYIGNLKNGIFDVIDIIDKNTLFAVYPNLSKYQNVKTRSTPGITEASNINVSNFYRPYITTIRTKPFLLLAGISGTGKSRIVKDMAFQTCPNVGDLRSDNVSPGNYCLVEVKPNWHDSTELLGYDSVISGGYIVTKFVKFLVKAMLNDDIPFFVCLDEMNLAPVEQYFAEFLSVLESRKKEGEEITSEALIDASVFKKHEATLFAELFDKEVEKSSSYGVADLTEDYAHYGKEYEVYERLKQEGLRIPKNLIVIGTVNMDETTHQFSRKVIDRAMTIEMNIAEGEQPFKDFFASDSELKYYDNPLSANLFLPKNVTAKQAMDELDLAEQDKLKELVPERLAAINNALDGTPFKIAYRVQNELLIYYCEMRRIDTETKTSELLNKAIDGILMMKVLPRVEGDRDLLEKPLEKLANICNDGYPEAYKKIKEMQGRLESAPFTSFWP